MAETLNQPQRFVIAWWRENRWQPTAYRFNDYEKAKDFLSFFQEGGSHYKILDEQSLLPSCDSVGTIHNVSISPHHFSSFKAFKSVITKEFSSKCLVLDVREDPETKIVHAFLIKYKELNWKRCDRMIEKARVVYIGSFNNKSVAEKWLENFLKMG